MSAERYRKFLTEAIRAAALAGRAILEVYGTDFQVTDKADHTPLTLADQRAHRIISAALKPLGLPLLSEEGREIPWQTRSAWDTLWVVDPLDGTKEFVKRNDEFTVNIALVENQAPVLGVIYVPVAGTLYFAQREMGAFKLAGLDCGSDARLEGSATLTAFLQDARRLPLAETPGGAYTIAGSRSHGTGELARFVEDQRRRHPAIEFISAGSSLKFCLVAEGRADIYPRFGPTSEWDTAAGQAIVTASGGSVVAQETGRPLVYNKQDLLNPWFLASGPNCVDTTTAPAGDSL
ncbi:MAG: 3'(2'),5'-bisphosphate nucleotidase CysQ [Desulfobacteraceae bacterium]|jgi:3'(2'), 5'-bisphosphate nucleotidase